LERRRANLDFVLQVIRRHPGIPILQLVVVLSKGLGLSRNKVIEYLKTLDGAGLIYEKQYKVYPRPKPSS